MPAYDKSYFLDRFKDADSEELVAKLLRGELTDDAVQAIREILIERGVGQDKFEMLIADARRGVLRSSGVTNQCDFCGRTTLMPLHDHGQKFCSQECIKQARLLERAVQIAPDLVLEHAQSMRVRPCPRCKRRASLLEMRLAFHIVSAFFFSVRSMEHELLCRRCGIRRNVGAVLLDFFLGWWSFAGLLGTPIFIYRNIREACQDRFDTKPSPELVHRAMMELAESLPPIERQLDNVSRKVTAD